MGRYFCVQSKRLLRHLPGVLLALLVLLLGAAIAFSALTADDSADQRVRIALVGTADDPILQMGMAAVSSVDSTRFTLELVELPHEAAARQALKAGEVAAYLVLPEHFMDNALAGDIRPIRFVSTAGATGMVTIFKEEVSRVISQVLLHSQKGVYGMQQAMRDHDIGGRGEKMTLLALKYVDYVLARDQMYRVESLGLVDELGLEGYLVCGLSVLLLYLCCLPFAPMLIRRDLSLARMLAARGKGVTAQTLCDLLVYGLGLTVPAALLCAAVSAVAQLPYFDVLAQALPVVALVAAFSYLLYTLSGDLIGGVLAQFFLSAAMCFVAGCMYPVYFFPVSVQKAAAYLPAGLARDHLAGCVTGQSRTLWLLGYALLFALAAVILRSRAVKEARV